MSIHDDDILDPNAPRPEPRPDEGETTTTTESLFSSPPPQAPQLRPGLKVDHETGSMSVPGVGDLPLVGPTSGREYADLKSREEDHAALMALLAKRITSTYRCIQCRRTYPGSRVILHTDTETGKTSLRCPDRTCAAPVMIISGPGGTPAV